MNDQPRCSGCGTAIQWVMTPNGKAMPLEVEPDPERRKGSYAVRPIVRGAHPAIPVTQADDDEPVYMNHWATCPKSGTFKRGKR